MDLSFTAIIGYIASALILISFTMKDMKKLRIINSFGCAFFVYYGILLGNNLPIIITNGAILLINVFSLIKNNAKN